MDMFYHNLSGAQAQSVVSGDYPPFDDTWHLAEDDIIDDLPSFNVDATSMVARYLHGVRKGHVHPQTAINDLVAFGMATDAVLWEIDALRRSRAGE